jgi:GntR family transcriptional regulator
LSSQSLLNNLGSGASQSTSRRALDQIRSMIQSGELPENEKLVEDQLAVVLGISRTTAREALQQLAEEGLVSRQRRAVTKVVRPLVPLSIGDIVPWKATVPFSVTRTDNRLVKSTPLIRQKLGIDDPLVGLVEHCFYVGAEPVGVRTAYYRPQFVQPEGWQHCPSLAEAFQRVYQISLGEIRSIISVVSCEPSTAAMLDVRTGSPVLLLEQTLPDISGMVYEYTFSYYRQGVTFQI